MIAVWAILRRADEVDASAGKICRRSHGENGRDERRRFAQECNLLATPLTRPQSILTLGGSARSRSRSPKTALAIRRNGGVLRPACRLGEKERHCQPSNANHRIGRSMPTSSVRFPVHWHADPSKHFTLVSW